MSERIGEADGFSRRAKWGRLRCGRTRRSDRNLAETNTGSPPWKTRVSCGGLFCGAGGTTRGDAHGYVIAGLDKQESCRKTYVADNGNETGDRGYPDFLAFDLFPATEDHPTGQQSKAFSQLYGLISEHRARFPEVPLLFAICAPCQPFTRLGKAKSSEGRVAERLRDRELLAHACRFVDRYVPDMVLSENVSGITDPRYAGV